MKKFFLVPSFFFFFLIILIPSSQAQVALENLYYVSNQTYCDFLKSVALEDPHGLYTPALIQNGIIRWGKPGFYQYSVIDGKEEEPITSIPWASAARCANWLEWWSNDETSIPESLDEITEHGVYKLNKENQCLEINTNAIYLLPRTTNEVAFSNFPEIGTWGTPDLERPGMAWILRDRIAMERIDATLGLSTIGIRFHSAVMGGTPPPDCPKKEWSTEDYLTIAGKSVMIGFVAWGGVHIVRKIHECRRYRNAGRGEDLTPEEIKTMNQETPSQEGPQQKFIEDKNAQEQSDRDNQFRIKREDGPIPNNPEELKELERVTREDIKEDLKEIELLETEKKKLEKRKAEILEQLKQLSNNHNPNEKDTLEAEKQKLNKELNEIRSHQARLTLNEQSEQKVIEHLKGKQEDFKELEKKLTGKQKDAQSLTKNPPSPGSGISGTPVPVDIENIKSSTVSSHQPPAEGSNPGSEKPKSTEQDKREFPTKFKSEVENDNKSVTTFTSERSFREGHQPTLKELATHVKNRQEKIKKTILTNEEKTRELKKEITWWKSYKESQEEKASTHSKGEIPGKTDPILTTLRSIFEEELKNNQIICESYHLLLEVKKRMMLLFKENLDPIDIDHRINNLHEQFEHTREEFRKAKEKNNQLHQQVDKIIEDQLQKRHQDKKFEQLQKKHHQEAKVKLQQDNKKQGTFSRWSFKKLYLKTETTNLLKDLKGYEADIAKMERDNKKILELNEKIDHAFNGTFSEKDQTPVKVPSNENLAPSSKAIGINDVSQQSRDYFIKSHEWIEELPKLIQRNCTEIEKLAKKINVDLSEIPESYLTHPKRLLKKIETGFEKVLEALDQLSATEKQAFDLADRIGTHEYNEQFEALQQHHATLLKKMEEQATQLDEEWKEAWAIRDKHLPTLKGIIYPEEGSIPKNDKKDEAKQIKKFKNALNMKIDSEPKKEDSRLPFEANL